MAGFQVITEVPGIPSAGEAQERGVSLGKMQEKLLAKIEELTLHLIDAEAQNRKLEERITRIETRGEGESSMRREQK